MNGIFRVDITPMHKAIREVLCNCLSNADYNETHGLVIKQYNDRIEFSNPGSFTIHKELAFSGGNSDARNKSILTMFNNINIGERTGSGIPLILNATKQAGYSTPSFKDFFNPDYTLVTIYLYNLDIQSQNLDIQSQNLDIQSQNLDIQSQNLNIDTTPLKKLILTRIFNKPSIRKDIKEKIINIYQNFQDKIFSSSSIVDLLECSRSSSDNYIKVLLNHNFIEPVKVHGKGKYKFK